MKIVKVIVNCIAVVGMILLIWIAASFVNTTKHNTNDKNFADWNFFSIVIEMMEE